VVEGEWGWIEEIGTTYVVVRWGSAKADCALSLSLRAVFRMDADDADLLEQP